MLHVHMMYANYIHIVYIYISSIHIIYTYYIYISSTVNPVCWLLCLVPSKNVKTGRMLWFMAWFIFAHIHALPSRTQNALPPTFFNPRIL